VLVQGTKGFSGVTYTPGTGFAELIEIVESAVEEWLNAAGAGPFTANMTASSAQDWASAAAAFTVDETLPGVDYRNFPKFPLQRTS